MNTKTILTRLSLLAVILAFIVVVLGAFTRLSDAGLGCPDWPGCYHHLIVPKNAVQAAEHYPQYPLEVGKAWTEMTHRYVAGSLALLILAIAGLMLWQRKQTFFTIIPFFLVALVIFQALLGMWTVTLRLWPVIVMLHLLGGLSILALLGWLYLKLNYTVPLSQVSMRSGERETISTVPRFLRNLSVATLLVLIIQIMLGGWTSSNYAALVCPDFPYCQAEQFFPSADFFNAFNLFASSHSIAQGTVLNHGALTVIHMTHRIGALIITIFAVLLSIGLLCYLKEAKLRILAMILLGLLVCQVSLGILNVILLLPLPVAVAHNAVAALLLLTLVAINFFIVQRRES